MNMREARETVLRALEDRYQTVSDAEGATLEDETRIAQALGKIQIAYNVVKGLT